MPTKATPSTGSNANAVARILYEHRVANYGIRSRLLTNNGPRFVSKFYVAVCSTLGLNNVITTEYCSQSNGYSELFPSTLIS